MPGSAAVLIGCFGRGITMCLALEDKDQRAGWPAEGTKTKVVVSNDRYSPSCELLRGFFFHRHLLIHHATTLEV